MLTHIGKTYTFKPVLKGACIQQSPVYKAGFSDPIKISETKL